MFELLDYSSNRVSRVSTRNSPIPQVRTVPYRHGLVNNGLMLRRPTRKNRYNAINSTKLLFQNIRILEFMLKYRSQNTQYANCLKSRPGNKLTLFDPPAVCTQHAVLANCRE